MARILVGLVVLAASGCASNLSALQSARTLDPGQVRLSAGAGVYVPGGQVLGAIGQGYDLTARGLDALAKNENYAWTPEDEARLVTSIVALSVMPPAPLFQGEIRAGIVNNVEAGLRVSTNAARLDGKVLVYHDGPEAPDPRHPLWFDQSTDVAIQVGVSKHFFSGFIFDALEFVQLGDFSRWDFELSVLMNREVNRWVGFYGGPRYVYSRTTFDETLQKLSYEAATLVKQPVTLPGLVNMHFMGATAGIRLGHPQVSLMLELTGGYTVAIVKVLGQDRDLGGVTVYPAAGLYVAF